MDSVVMFDIGSPAHGLITQAAIAFRDRVRVGWSFDALTALLATFYNADGNASAIPQLYPATNGRDVVGYLALRECDWTQRDLDEVFWAAMVASERAVQVGYEYRYLGDPPFVGLANVDGMNFSVLGFQNQFGPALPLRPINYALMMLLGQGNWPTSLAPFLYPVSKNASPLLAGIWVAPTVDDLNLDPDADDAVFRAINRFNFPGMNVLGQRNLHAALSRFPDFRVKEFC